MAKPWICKTCGTMNDCKYCQQCGSERPSSSSGLIITLVVILAALLVTVVCFVAYMLLNEPDPEPEESAVVEVVETVYYVNKFDDSGIFVREGPDKSYDDILYIKKGDQSVLLEYLGEQTLGDDNYTWYLVETPSGEVGYVREDVVVQY